jgi:hypothetical protein
MRIKVKGRNKPVGQASLPVSGVAAPRRWSFIRQAAKSDLRPQARKHILRRGSLAAELLLLLPILMTVVLGIVEIGMLEFCEQQLCAASREGCRVAAQGGDQKEVEDAVRRYLGDGRLGDCDIEVVLTDQSGRPLHCGDPVEVHCRIKAHHCVPNLLCFIGCSIRDKDLCGHTVMRNE